MGYFDRKNLKTITNLLRERVPGVEVTQVLSPYRDDDRDVLRVEFNGFYADLAENDREWLCVLAEDGPGGFDQRVISLGVAAWAPHRNVADAFASLIQKLSEAEQDIANEDVDRPEQAEFLSQRVATTPAPVPRESTPRNYEQPRSNMRIFILVAAIVLVVFLLQSCGSGGWRIGVDGDGSRVQCSDGTWSNSGGKSGACSWHGGVR